MKGDHWPEQHCPREQARMPEQKAGGDIRAVRISHCEYPVAHNSIHMGCIGDESSQLIRPLSKVFLVEDPLGQTSEEPRHAVFQNTAPWAEQCSSGQQFLTHRDQVLLVPARAVEEEQRYPDEVRRRNKAVN